MSSDLASARFAEVLLVEDNEDDVLFTRESFRRSKLAVNLHHVEDGVECMAFLRKEGAYADAPTPDLILLDLNMPRMDGREVLAAITQDEALHHLPVVILTTSKDEGDILLMYELRCNSYMVKPVDFDQFMDLVKTMNDYWFTVAVLPHKP